MKAKAYRQYTYAGSKEWDVIVYWSCDPEKDQNWSDYDAMCTPKEWRKWSGLPSPKKGFGIEVEINVAFVRNFKDRE